VLVSFLATLFIILRDPWIQTTTARVASHYLSEKVHAEIRIGSFGISLGNGLSINDITVRDRHQAILFAAHRLSVVPGRISLSKHILSFRKVAIDKGVIQLLTHKGDTSLNLQFLVDFFSPTGVAPPRVDTVKSLQWDLSISTLLITGTRFHLQDENKPLEPVGMDYSNIDVRNINLLLTDFRPYGDTLNATIKSLSAYERSGFRIHSMSGEFSVSPAFLKAHNMKLVTDHSNLDLSFEFLYDHWIAYTDFLEKVHIRASINPSWFDLQDIGAYAPVMYIMKDRFHMQGEIRGTVSNFTAKDFRFDYGTRTKFRGNVHANGLPNVEETFVDLNIREFTTTSEDIRSFNLPIAGKNLALPGFLKNAGTYHLTGSFTGFYNDFVADASLGTDIGQLKTNLTLRKQKGIKGLFYKGEADVTGLQLGALFKESVSSKEMLGPITLRADLNGQGFTLNDAIVKMNVWVDSVYLNGYTYKHLILSGDLSDKKFTGKMEIDDPNLRFSFDGLVDLRDSLPSFNFMLALDRAQLFRMNVLKRDSLEDLSARVRVDFKGNSIDNIEGTINVQDAGYREGTHTILMKHLGLITSQDEKNNRAYHLTSDFVDADFTGNFYFSDLVPSVISFIKNYLASFTLKEKLIDKHPSTNQHINYDIRLKKTDAFMEVFVPFLRVAPNTSLKGYYNEDEGIIALNGTSSDVIVNGIHFSDWYIKATNRQDNLNINTGCGRLFVNKEKGQDTTLIMMDSLNLVSDMHHDSIFYNLVWQTGKNQSNIGGFANFRNSPVIQVKMERFHTFIDQHYWTIATDNEVLIDTSSVVFHDFGLESGDQKLRIDGTMSGRSEDTLRMTFDNVDISHLDILAASQKIDLDGFLSGHLKLMNVTKSLTLLSEISIEKLAFNKELLGDARFNVFYDERAERFDVDSKILYTGNAGTNIPLELRGSYYMGKHEPHINFDLSLKNLNLKMVSPYVSSFMSRLSGLASGHVRITGSPDKPNLAGKLNLMRTEFVINYLNIPYSLADTVTIDSSSFRFNRIAIYDSLGNKAFLSGRIYHHYFSDLGLDLNIEAADFSAFHNTFAQNNIFYGTARATGDIRIFGPVDDISLTAKVQTGGGTHVYIPISSSADLSQNDYIVFTKDMDDSTRREESRAITTPKGFSLGLALMVNPSADVDVIFPGQVGNIKASGSGNLAMDMTPTTGFQLSGTYAIQKGSFHFQMKNLMRLDFIIQNGSRITWSGDPANAMISMKAIYKTRVPMENITSDEQMKSQRVAVECIIRLSGELANPELSFGMNLPNAEESVKSVVYAAIDTTNAAEMNQQMFNILVFNQFQSNKSGSDYNINVGTTSMSILTNQFNSFLSQISRNVNVGVNYRRASNTTGQEIDLAVSTQLFNERLLIDGLFGVNSMNPSSTAQNASTIVGDINLEYILSDNRRWRVRAFNRTNTVSTLENNAPYTQGVGISYQRDFRYWGELFMKDKKKKKEK
jgi:hypothetical protein